MIIASLREDTTGETAPKESIVENTKPVTETISLSYNVESVSVPPDVVLQCRRIETPTKTIFDDLCECYSVRKNMKMLLSVQKSSNAVPIIDGLK